MKVQMLLARFISFISNPIFILIGLPFFLVLRNTGDLDASWRWSYYTWFFLFIFGAYVVTGVKKGFFSDLDVSKREQRFGLYLFGAILCFFYLIGLILYDSPIILLVCLFGIMLGILVGSLVTLRVKASVHVAAASALIVGLSMVYGGYFFLMFLLIPIICWARVKIKRHSEVEVVAGGLIGSLLSLLMYYFARMYIVF